MTYTIQANLDELWLEYMFPAPGVMFTQCVCVCGVCGVGVCLGVCVGVCVCECRVCVWNVGKLWQFDNKDRSHACFYNI